MGSTRPGKHTQFAIEAMAIENTGFTQLENGDFPQLCKRLPEGTTSVHVFVTLVQIFGFVIHVFPRAAENRIAADSPENVRFFFLNHNFPPLK